MSSRYLDMMRSQRRRGSSFQFTSKSLLASLALIAMGGSAVYWWGVQSTLIPDNKVVAAAFTAIRAAGAIPSRVWATAATQHITYSAACNAPGAAAIAATNAALAGRCGKPNRHAATASIADTGRNHGTCANLKCSDAGSDSSDSAAVCSGDTANRGSINKRAALAGSRTRTQCF